MFPFGGIVAGDAKMRAALELGRSVAPTDATVLITGETGTGKELMRASHPSLEPAGRTVLRRRELRCFRPVPAGERAVRSRERVLHRGRGPAAGALRTGARRDALLDEVGEMTHALQAKLLRVLQEGTFERVGGTKTVTVDVRVIAATNRDLQRLVAPHILRDVLFYRLSVFPILLPPLRERRRYCSSRRPHSSAA